MLNFSGQKCLVCGDEAEGKPSVICIVCGDCYHCACHEPRVGKTTRKSTWKCAACKEKETGLLSDSTKEEPEKLSVTVKSKLLDEIKEKDKESDTSSRRTSNAISELPSEEDNDFNGFNDPAATNGGQSKADALKENNNVDLVEDTATGFKFNIQKAKQLLKTSANNNPNFDTVPGEYNPNDLT